MRDDNKFHREKRYVEVDVRFIPDGKMTYFIEAAEITTRTHPEARFIIVGDGEEREQLHLQQKKYLKAYTNDFL